MPIGKSVGFRKELIELGSRDARLATAIRYAAETGNDLVNDRGGGAVFCRIGRDNPVPVKVGGGENFNRVGRIFGGDGRGIGFAKVGEDLLRRGPELRLFNFRQGQFGQTFQ